MPRSQNSIIESKKDAKNTRTAYGIQRADKRMFSAASGENFAPKIRIRNQYQAKETSAENEVIKTSSTQGHFWAKINDKNMQYAFSA